MDNLIQINNNNFINFNSNKYNTVKLTDVLKNIFQNNKGNTITEETLLSLYYIFDQSIIASLEILDKELIRKYKFLPSERSFYVIEGRKGSKHMCLIDGDYCSCPSFNFVVLLKSESVYATEIMSNVKIEEFDDSEYQNKVKEIEEASLKTPTHRKGKN
ncbi:hypothetical protein DICPUDRAFT_153265 [Dictyostelium purpureum]|uniref:SWIM-type domain-containing protein n=1 Tax=Dictyostelium purpureum TaxID=5786 RepID=F0ZNG4_DICPU|nr:uncharacterized protein DICPUDRAFT_153265 [Dictyostelium purpureum]EGC34527.1 hypothetical protein DICPUDRAFT_153265 [Dictyostelium purpureum]|eukprot:XP_003288963.1 hypothetical protein DICPUDRAFT_153265 [Dictyostelium purpureum]